MTLHVNMDQRLETLSKDLAAVASVRRNEPMIRHTTFRVGGEADLYVEAKSSEQLERILRVVAASGIAHKVIGGGSNILVSDKGYRGLVVRNRSSQCRFLDGNRVEYDSGFSLSSLVKSAASRGLSGMEWAVGIPGSIGGAVTGNAGAFGKSIADVLTETLVINAAGERRLMSASDMGFAYRKSNIKGDSTVAVLAVIFQLSPESPERIFERIAEFTAQRKLRQPGGASAGSVFKNPEEAPAGLLIEKAGLKGKTLGGARISTKHANFIVNAGNATAGEIRELMDLAITTVQRRFGISLEPEIELMGEWN